MRSNTQESEYPQVTQTKQHNCAEVAARGRQMYLRLKEAEARGLCVPLDRTKLRMSLLSDALGWNMDDDIKKIEAAIVSAVAAERERCAKGAEDYRHPEAIAELMYGSAFYYGSLTRDEWLTVLVRTLDQVRDAARERCAKVAMTAEIVTQDEWVGGAEDTDQYAIEVDDGKATAEAIAAKIRSGE